MTVEDDTTNDLEAIQSTRLRLVQLGQLEVEVRPLTVGQLPAFSKAVRPVLDTMVQWIDVEDVQLAEIADLVEAHGDAMINAAAIATDMDAKALGRVEFDEFIELIVAIVLVNADFFAHRLLPGLATTASELTQIARGDGGGRTQSNTLQKAATR